jgi:hypothetical protein
MIASLMPVHCHCKLPWHHGGIAVQSLKAFQSVQHAVLQGLHTPNVRRRNCSVLITETPCLDFKHGGGQLIQMAQPVHTVCQDPAQATTACLQPLVGFLGIPVSSCPPAWLKL